MKATIYLAVFLPPLLILLIASDVLVWLAGALKRLLIIIAALPLALLFGAVYALWALGAAVAGFLRWTGEDTP